MVGDEPTFAHKSETGGPTHLYNCRGVSWLTDFVHRAEPGQRYYSLVARARSGESETKTRERVTIEQNKPNTKYVYLWV